MKINGLELPRNWWIPFVGAGGLLVLGSIILAVIWSGGLIPDADQSRLSVERDNPTIQQLDRAIDLNPTYSQAYIKRARLLLSEGKFDPAIADVDKALTLSPGDQSLLLLRAEIRHKRVASSQPAK